MAKKTQSVKKKVVKVGANGMAFVHSTFNNVIITITNEVGEVISWSSAGKMGFRGSKKNTPYAAQTAAADCAKVAFDMGLRKVKVYAETEVPWQRRYSRPPPASTEAFPVGHDDPAAATPPPGLRMSKPHPPGPDFPRTADIQWHCLWQ